MARKVIVRASKYSDAPRLSQDASRIADSLSDWLGQVASMPNVEDYLDEYDMEHLGNSVDALYYFAQAYATDVNGI